MTMRWELRLGIAVFLAVVTIATITYSARMQDDFGEAQQNVDAALTLAINTLNEKCGVFAAERNDWETVNNTETGAQLSDAKAQMDEAETACFSALQTLEGKSGEVKAAFEAARDAYQSVKTDITATQAEKNEAKQERDRLRNDLLAAGKEIREESDKAREDFKATLAQWQATKDSKLTQDLEERKKHLEKVRSERFEQACGMLNSTKIVPADYGASFDVLSSRREQIVKATCDREVGDALVEVGNGSAQQYVYRYGYLWEDGQWDKINLDPVTTSAMPAENWHSGKASADLPMKPEDLDMTHYFVGYTCSWTGTQWKCGCRDAACTTNHWQLQEVKPN